MQASPLLRFLACVTAMFASACARSEPVKEPLARRGSPPAVQGCYVLAAGSDTLAVTRARKFRLDLGPLIGAHPEVHRATSLIDSAGERLSAWSADSLTDTVRVAIGDGFTGVTVIVIPTPTGLHGRAVGYSDAGPSEFELGKVVYRKQPCAPGS